MYFTITHPMHSHPYNPELLSGDGIGKVAAATEAAGIHGFGFTDHPAPSQRWLEAGDTMPGILSSHWVSRRPRRPRCG